MFNLGPMEMMVIGLIGVLLFGKRLPEVGRSLGKGIVEFKKGLNGIDDDDDRRPSTPAKHMETHPLHDSADAAVPKFEPPTSPPVPRTDYEPQPYQD
jgi:sec-independent protein translocase protein TatA